MNTMLHQYFSILIISIVFLIPVITPMAESSSDQTPPEIDSVFPWDGQTCVNPYVTIEVAVFDPDPVYGTPGSGIDIDSISLTLNGEDVPIFIDQFDSDGAMILSDWMGPLPEQTWIRMEFFAKDNAGNAITGFSWSFLTGIIPDSSPPEFAELSPPDHFTDIIPTAQISCKVMDRQSDIDISSAAMAINGIFVTPDLRRISKGIHISFTPPQPFPYGQWINVRVYATDLAGNPGEVEWSFQTESAPPVPPRLSWPKSNALLNYQIERGVVRFEWSHDSGDQYYRLYLVISNTRSFEMLDLGPSDYILIGDMVRLNYPISERNWQEISRLGSILWRVAKIDGYGGRLITSYSVTSSFNLAPPRAVVLRTPHQNALFTSGDTSPVFTWDPFNNASSYLFGMIRIGNAQELIDEVIVRNLSFTTTSFSFRPEYWRSLPSGRYIWTVVAYLPGDFNSDFMNYTFDKTNTPLVENQITNH